MVFTAPEDAKAKIPHKMGLPCLGCGVMTAAEWRGPGGRYGSCCRKAADEARAALRGGKQESVVAELTERVEKAEAVIEQQRTQLSEQADAIAGLQRQLAQLSQQVLQRPRETAHTGNAAPARKRPALADQSNAPPAPPAMRLNKAPLVPRAPVMPAAVAPPAPAAAPPPAAAGPKLIDGWKTRQSTSRGCQVWEYGELQLEKPPTRDEAQVELLVEIIEEWQRQHTEHEEPAESHARARWMHVVGFKVKEGRETHVEEHFGRRYARAVDQVRQNPISARQ